MWVLQIPLQLVLHIRLVPISYPSAPVGGVAVLAVIMVSVAMVLDAADLGETGSDATFGTPDSGISFRPTTCRFMTLGRTTLGLDTILGRGSSMDRRITATIRGSRWSRLKWVSRCAF